MILKGMDHWRCWYATTTYPDICKVLSQAIIFKIAGDIYAQPRSHFYKFRNDQILGFHPEIDLMFL